MTPTRPTSHTTEQAHDTAPKLAAGVELLGRYEGSGFKEPPYLIRRGDGQMIRLPQLLYLVAEQADGARDYGSIADAVGGAISRRVAARDVQFLIDEKLRPLGLLEGKDGVDVPSLPKTNPLLGLKYKAALVPARVVRILAAIFSPLFLPPVILAVLAGVVALDYWLFAVHGVAQSLRETLYEPGTLLLVFGLVLVSAIFHECGHAAATRYGGAQPGAMGAGLYFVWPAFYTDLTDAYTLGRGGRLRADLGGVYFNAIFMLGTAGAYFLTGFEPLLLLIPLQHLEIVHQLLPFFRLDGYYVVSDLTGVPDILSRVKPTLRSLLPGVETDPRVQELKPWARAVVTVYVSILVPVLIALFSIMAFAAPRVFATAWDASGVTWQRAHTAIDRREEVTSLASLVQLGLLGLSPVGIALTLASAVRRIAAAVWGWTDMRPWGRAVLVAVTSGTLTTLFATWWMNGAYRPIGVGERGTLSARALDVRAVVGRESQHSATPLPAEPASAPPRSRVEASILRDHPKTRVNPAPGSGTTTTRVTPWWAGTGGATTSPDQTATDPDPGTEWTAPVGTTTETHGATSTETTPTSTTSDSTSTTTATTTTP
jgi:putative peptide zinc metalloprotease protein